LKKEYSLCKSTIEPIKINQHHQGGVRIARMEITVSSVTAQNRIESKHESEFHGT